MGAILRFRARTLADALALPSPERLDVQWCGVADALDRRRPKRALWAGGLLALAAGTAALVFVPLHDHPMPPPSTTVAAAPTELVTETASRDVDLPAGARAALAPHGRLRFAQAGVGDVRLELLAGRARFEVPADPERTFLIDTGSVRFRVNGTRFDLAVGERGHVELAVSDGRVRAFVGGEVREIGPGERWTPGAPAPGSAPAVNPKAPPSRAARRHADEAGQQLFDEAMRARAAGDNRAAAALLDAVRRRPGAKALAGLAAFELGRLRLDVLDDARGAVAAFDDALRTASPTLREDIEARLVTALERSGAVASCRTTRDAYLARHPRGVHAADVARRCP